VISLSHVALSVPPDDPLYDALPTTRTSSIKTQAVLIVRPKSLRKMFLTAFTIAGSQNTLLKRYLITFYHLKGQRVTYEP